MSIQEDGHLKIFRHILAKQKNKTRNCLKFCHSCPFSSILGRDHLIFMGGEIFEKKISKDLGSQIKKIQDESQEKKARTGPLEAKKEKERKVERLKWHGK